MRTIALATALCLALCFTAFAQETAKTEEAPAPEAKTAMTGTVKITVAPAIKHVAAYTAATALIKAADVAPEGGWADKDHNPAFMAMAQKGFGLLGEWLKTNNVQHSGPAFSIYYEDPMETKATDLTMKCAFPISGTPDPAVGIVIEEMPEMDVASVTYAGKYEESGNAWQDLMNFVTAQGYVFAGAPMEIYIVDPHANPNPEAWITEVQWPVKKAEPKPEEGKKE